jgi:hypothetical protein
MGDTDRPGEPDEPVGSVGEEAAKLLGALSGWAQEHKDVWGSGVGDGLSGLADQFGEHLATGAPECTWCPVCRTVHAIRETSPEVRDHLTSAATSLMLAISGMMAPPAGRARSADTDQVERIELDDDWPEDDE